MNHLRLRVILALTVITLNSRAGAASPPTIEDFASRPQIEDVTISPDGRYLAFVDTRRGKGIVVVDDRKGGKDRTARALFEEPDQFLLNWCRWATNTRLLCSLRAITTDRGYLFPLTRLVAVDADGKNLRILMQNSREVQGQYQDQIINWHPGPPDVVLIQADEGLSESQMSGGVTVIGNVGTHNLPAVWELNVVTGRLAMRQPSRDPIRRWVTDRFGQVRMGSGFAEGTISYWVHLDGDSNWRRLSKFEIFSRENHFRPIAISAENPDMAYAIGPSEGRDAIWLIDLKDKEEPKLLFSHPLVNVSGTVISRDSRFIGARYDNGYPMMYYADERADDIMRSFQKLNPGAFSTIGESSLDDKVLLIRSITDIDGGRFWLFDADTHAASKIGGGYPDRDTSTLGAMRPISYTARDGTTIPAYLSSPKSAPGSHPPLVVMPHGGPIARDTWGYFFLRQFLVSRGYAVLQMNFRGSSGYGDDWFFAAHQDWGGLTYDDVVDGARWAVHQGIANANQVCIVGWSFGGYLALLGAQRNPDLFHCAVDIAGVSDLPMLVEEGHQWMSGETVRKKQIGTDSAKLKRDSPRLHASEFQVPLLMLHGRRDYQVPFEQSDVMDAALKRAGKPHRFVVVPDADHPFSAPKDRAVLLREIETFLGEQLPASASTAP